MNTPNVFVLTRSAERILVTLTGAFAIFLGYKLFATVATAESVANVKTAAISIYVSNVGPGVFFALFGTGLIGYAITRAVQFEQKVDGAISASGIVADFRYRGFEDRPGPAAGPSRGRVACEGVVKTLAEMTKELGAKSNPEPRKEMALREARVSLMSSSWKDEWGRLDEFKDWVYNFAEGDPPPASINRAVAIYRGTAWQETGP
jgi:hypothetical protein